MYFFERTLVRVFPTHTVSGPGGGATRPPPDTATSIQAPFGCSANPAHTLGTTPTHTTLIQAPCGCHPSTVRLPCQPSAGGGAFWDTHTNTKTQYTASSSIQAPFGCPANPALVVHALERLRLCCSILLVRDNQHNTQQKHFTSLCPGLRKIVPSQKSLLVLTKPYNSNGCDSNQTARRTTPWHANNQLVGAFLDTHTPTPTHTTLLVVPPIAKKHSSAALPTQRWWCIRWNGCVSAVRSCSCGTTNTTHSKDISLRYALGCGKKVPSQKSLLVLTKP